MAPGWVRDFEAGHLVAGVVPARGDEVFDAAGRVVAVGGALADHLVDDVEVEDGFEVGDPPFGVGFGEGCGFFDDVEPPVDEFAGGFWELLDPILGVFAGRVVTYTTDVSNYGTGRDGTISG